MFANVVFMNIDWKSSRMLRTLETNMRVLATTIAGVVRNMNPTMLCMCEVGETNCPLTRCNYWRPTAHMRGRMLLQSTSSYAACLPPGLHT